MDIFKEIQSRLADVVRDSLYEAGEEKNLQLKLKGELGSDPRSLRAGQKQEAEKADEDDSEESATAPKSDKEGRGGDYSVRKVKVPEALPATITSDMVVKVIDSIRSARSLRDEEIRGEFDEYFDMLDGDEKIAMYAFLVGIAQTLIDPGPSTVDPSNSPFNIKLDADPVQKDTPSSAKEPVKKKDKKDIDKEIPIIIGQ